MHANSHRMQQAPFSKEQHSLDDLKRVAKNPPPFLKNAQLYCFLLACSRRVSPRGAEDRRSFVNKWRYVRDILEYEQHDLPDTRDTFGAIQFDTRTRIAELMTLTIPTLKKMEARPHEYLQT